MNVLPHYINPFMEQGPFHYPEQSEGSGLRGMTKLGECEFRRASLALRYTEVFNLVPSDSILLGEV